MGTPLKYFTFTHHRGHWIIKVLSQANNWVGWHQSSWLPGLMDVQFHQREIITLCQPPPMQTLISVCPQPACHKWPQGHAFLFIVPKTLRESVYVLNFAFADWCDSIMHWMSTVTWSAPSLRGTSTKLTQVFGTVTAFVISQKTFKCHLFLEYFLFLSFWIMHCLKCLVINLFHSSLKLEKCSLCHIKC